MKLVQSSFRLFSLIYILAISMAALQGCDLDIGGDGGDGGDGDDTYSVDASPVISNLVLYPVSATVNEGNGSTKIAIEVDYTDPNRDVVALRFTSSRGDDQTILLEDNYENGTTGGVFEVDTLMKAQVELDVWVVDSQGNNSNVLTYTLPVTHDLDSQFGTGGVVIDGALNIHEEAHDVAIQDDDKIVIAGNTQDPYFNLLVKRYTSNGTPDYSFASNGSFIFDNAYNESATALAIQPDGKIVITGTITGYSDIKTLVMRLNPDGTLDSTFGANGIVTTDVASEDGSSIISGSEVGNDILVQPDGKLVVAGEAVEDKRYPVVLRYNSDGSLDGSFADNGIYRYTFSDENIHDYAEGVVLQSDGKIVVAGSAGSQEVHEYETIDQFGSTITVRIRLNDVLAFRLNPDGTLDSTFGNSGAFHYDENADLSEERCVAVGIQDDGNIVIGCDSKVYDADVSNAGAIAEGALIIRLTNDGNLDSTFAEGGVFRYEGSINYEDSWIRDYLYTEDMMITNDGRIVLIGQHNIQKDLNETFVIRLTSNGSLDTTFSVDGISSINTAGTTRGYAVAPLKEGSIYGNILIAGTFDTEYTYFDVLLFALE